MTWPAAIPPSRKPCSCPEVAELVSRGADIGWGHCPKSDSLEAPRWYAPGRMKRQERQGRQDKEQRRLATRGTDSWARIDEPAGTLVDPLLGVLASLAFRSSSRREARKLALAYGHFPGYNKKREPTQLVQKSNHGGFRWSSFAGWVCLPTPLKRHLIPRRGHRRRLAVMVLAPSLGRSFNQVTKRTSCLTASS